MDVKESMSWCAVNNITIRENLDDVKRNINENIKYMQETAQTYLKETNPALCARLDSLAKVNDLTVEEYRDLWAEFAVALPDSVKCAIVKENGQCCMCQHNDVNRDKILIEL